MVQLHQDYPRFASLNCEIIVISPDPPAAFHTLWQAEQFHFLGLPDLQHQVLDLYGQRVNWLKLGRMPAQALIDHQGMLRFLHYGGSMSDISTNAQLLTQVAALRTHTS
jgi:peroxiredoxin